MQGGAAAEMLMHFGKQISVKKAKVIIFQSEIQSLIEF